VDALFDATAEWGTVTGLVNNAGVTLHLGDLVDTPVDVVRRMIDVNLTGAVLVARRAVRDMVDGGAIVNVSSAAATLGSPHEYVHYAAAKAGVDAFTFGLAAGVASRGIRVNAVAPGLIRTEIHASAGDAGRLERIAGTVPARRAGEPEEVAEAVAWLMSDACPYATGAVLRVAGGR
ncbi:MAG: SDR family oxidoreductase, partial [Nocardioidaceae bacterium]